MSEAPKQGSYLGQAWLVILLALLYGGALAGVQTALGPIIDDNKKKETISAIPTLVRAVDEPERFEVTVRPDRKKKGVYMVSVTPILRARADESKGFEMMVEEMKVTGEDGNAETVYKASDAGGALLGWVLSAGGQGFADRIELLIGLKADLSTISGLYVLEQKETPGLGDHITDSSFCRHFQDQPTEPPLVVVSPSTRADPTARVDGEIVAISGATISSDSVAEIVNLTIDNFRQPIREQLLGGGAESLGLPLPKNDQQ